MRTKLTIASQLLLTGIASAGTGGLFTENKGQWPEHVFFRTSFSQHAVFVGRNTFTVVAWSGGGTEHTHGTALEPVASAMHRHAYRVQFLGSNGTQPMGSSLVAGVENFFLGNDPARWGANAHRYQELVSTDLYPGIDLRMKADGSFKYELIVHPGASTDIITLAYEGQEGLQLKNGDLLIHTSAGTMVEQAPIAYQEHNSTRKFIPCIYALEGSRLRYSFPEGYDRTLPLVIDPSLVFSTFSGSTSDNFAFGATYDTNGHLYACGTAFGVGYPTTLGAYQTTWMGGDGGAALPGTDIVLTKFALDGSSLLWSTFLGGTADECPLGVVVNAADELFLMAVTGSPNHPTTPGAYDQTFHGGPAYSPQGSGVVFANGHDLILARLSADGASLMACTFLGGTGGDGCNTTSPLTHSYGDNFRGGLVLDANGDPVVATSTSSTDLPTINAPQPQNAGGQDGYVFRMNAQLDALPWATYLGGIGDDAAHALRINSVGEIIVTGGTTSNDLPMNGTPFNGTFGGIADAYVARYSAVGDQLLSSTYLGTGAYDQGFFIDIDGLDAVVVLGQSEGGYDVTPGIYSNTNSANFLQKLNADLSTGIWSTVIGNGGGTTDISPIAFGVDATGRILLCGFADDILGGNGTTFGFPVTPDALQGSTDGHDLYIGVLAAGASSLIYGTFLGGTQSFEHAEGGSSAIDDNGNLYLAICVCGAASDFPTTPGVWSATNNGPNCNLTAIKFTTDGTMATTEIGTMTDVLVWPTPTNAFLRIRGCDDPPCEVTITDAIGQVVARTRMTAASTELSVDRFAPGVYHMHMGEGAGSKHARFVVR